MFRSVFPPFLLFIGLLFCDNVLCFSEQDLLFAAGSGDVAKVEAILVENAFDVSMKFKEHTALHAAAANGHIDVAKALLAAGVPVSVKNFNNSGPITAAVLEDQADMVEFLYRNGADLNEHIMKDEVYYPLLVWAAGDGALRVVERLLDLGVDIDTRSVPLTGLKHRVGGETALLAAGFQGRTEVVKLLLQRGADRSLSNRQGNTALHAATYANKPATLQALVDSGGFNTSAKNDDGFAPVMLAAHAGATKCLRILMKAGASIDAPPRIDFNPLIVSVRTYNVPLFKEVLSWKPNVNGYDSVNFSALYHSLSNNHHDMGRQLLRRGAAVGRVDEYLKGIMDEWTRFVPTCDWFYGILKSNGLSTKQVSGPEPHLGYCELIQSLKAYKSIVKLIDQADLYGYDGLVSRLNFKSFTDSIDGNFEGVKKAKERAYADIKHLHKIDYRKKYEVDVEEENEMLPNILHRFSDKVEPPRPKDEKEMSLSDILGAEDTVRQVHRPPPEERPQHVRSAETLPAVSRKKSTLKRGDDDEL